MPEMVAFQVYNYMTVLMELHAQFDSNKLYEITTVKLSEFLDIVIIFFVPFIKYTNRSIL